MTDVPVAWLVTRFFCIRAGMLGWFLINLSVAAKQYMEQGSLSLSMALFQAFCAVSFTGPAVLFKSEDEERLREHSSD